MSKFTVKRIVNTAFPRPHVLLELVVSENAATMRVYGEIACEMDGQFGITGRRADSDLSVGLHHVSTSMPLLTGQKAMLSVPGEKLRPDLKGRWFAELGSSMVKRGWYEGAGEHVDCGLWCMPIDYFGNPEIPFNATTENVERKGTAKRAAASRQMHDAVLIFTPFADTPFTECPIIVRANAELGVISNVPLTVDNSPLQDVAASMRPVIRLKNGGGSIAADQREEVEVEVIDPNTGSAIANSGASLFLEATAGYLPHRRVKVAADGSAKFSVRALDLAAGDSFKVKVGFRQYTGVLDVPFDVI